MGNPFFIVDVFAQAKYAGNQLAVVVHDGELGTDVMQRIARETNFSETTFVQRPQRPDGAWDVRIFTPAAELSFAGHPTLGTAWVLRHCIDPARPDLVVLQLPVGPTPVRFAGADSGAVGWLTAPLPAFGRRFDPAPLAELLGLGADDLDPNLPIAEVTLGSTFAFVPLANRAALARARFRSDRHEAMQHLDLPPCVFAFCRSEDDDVDLRARMFATPLGIVEDPATGSANACLAAYLLRHVDRDRASIAVTVAQGVEMGRPSLLRLAAGRRGDQAVIEVGGRVELTVRGELV